jgi:hypothetical protein
MSDPAPIPESLLIGTVAYRVTIDPDDWMRIEHETKTGGYYGHTQHRTAMIYLNPGATPDVTRLTLWHEVLHALAEAAMGSPEWRKLGGTKDEREERVIRTIEAPTLAVLRANPQLVAYLMEGTAVS